MKFCKYCWNVFDAAGARFKHDNRECGDGKCLLVP